MASGPTADESMAGIRAILRRANARRWAIAGLGTVVAAGLLASAGIGTPDDEDLLTTEVAAESTEVEETSPTTSPPAPATTAEAPAPTTTEPPETTTTEPPAPATTEAPTTTTTEPPPPADEPLRQGNEGEKVRELQQQLVDLGYWLSDVNGRYGHTTQQAVMAFQKNEGLGRDGVAGEQTLGRLPDAAPPTIRSTAGNVIEVDLERQLMFIIQDGQLVHALNTSSGAPGWSTPPGEFVIDRQIDGWRHAELGTLYRPKYFNRGIALHGSPSIPGHPASHGCTRLSNEAIDMLWASGLAEVGTKVLVY